MAVMALAGCDPSQAPERQEEASGSNSTSPLTEKVTAPRSETLGSAQAPRQEVRIAPQRTGAQQAQATKPEETIDTIGAPPSERFRNGNRSVVALTGLIVALIVSLLLLMRAQSVILRWRRAVEGGLEAVVPQTLETNLANVLKRQVAALDQRIDATSAYVHRALTETERHLASLEEIVKKLRDELDRKDADNKHLRSLLNPVHKEEQIRHAVKLSRFLDSVRAQLGDGRLAPDQALSFLSDEIRDTLEGHNVRTLIPDADQILDDKWLELVNIENEAALKTGVSEDVKMIIRSVKTPAYVRYESDGTTQVIQKALVTVEIRG